MPMSIRPKGIPLDVFEEILGIKEDKKKGAKKKDINTKKDKKKKKPWKRDNYDRKED